MAWFIVRYSTAMIGNEVEQNRFFVEEGDIIKFGRVRFKIRKLRILGSDLSESEYSNYTEDRRHPEATVEDGLNQ